MTATTLGLVSVGGSAAAWLLTYWLHSTLLMGSAWVLSRWVLRREAWRDVMWKAALLGGVVTTTVSVWAPSGWGVRLSVPLAVATADAPAGDPSTPHVLQPATDREAPIPRGRAAEPVAPDGAERGSDIPPANEQPPSSGPSAAGGGAEDLGRGALRIEARRDEESTGPLGPGAADDPLGTSPAQTSAVLYLALGWGAAAFILLLALLRRHVRLHHLLQGRRTLSGGPLPALLAGLRRSTGFWRPVRLTASASVATPLALGRGEICVPERFLHALGEEEQKAALAHELGHLVRRDPAWNLAAQLLEAVFFFQPLHRLARARLRDSAEFLADEWAAQGTGSRLGLARCLAEVADWLSSVERPELAGSVAMAEGGSPLMARVRRLLESEPEAATPTVAGRAAAVGLVVLTGALAPAVSSATSGSEVEPVPPVSRSGEELAPPQTVEVVRVSATGTLPERMQSARAAAGSAGARAYWLAYVVAGNVRVGENVAEDTGPWEGWPVRGPAIEGLLRVVDEVGPAGSGDLIVLAQEAPGAGEPRVVRLAVRTPGLAIDLQGRPVYWLGRAPAGESLAWSRGLFENGGQESTVRVAALEVASRHGLPEARQLLVDVATSATELTFREEAIEGLAHHPEDATVDVLARLAQSDRSPVVQEEAAETLGEVDNPRAAAALESLVRSSAPSATKEEALEALVERADTLLAGLLLELALRDPDPELRIEAVERMAELPTADGLPLLRRVLGESTDRQVRIEAVEAIGEIGTEEALAALDGLLADSDREIALEAAETIGEFPAEMAAPRLARLAREHPSIEVREEAIDQLSELGGTAVVGDVLLELAMTSTDADIRAQAVESMEDLPTDQAVALLARVAFESGDPGAQRQAAETLGEVGSTEALRLLDRLAREASDETVARRAVESMGEFPEDQAGPLLRRIATEHPSARVRREALSQLGGSSES